MVVLALRGGWIPAFAGMTTGENESGRNGGNDTGKESTYKREVHPAGAAGRRRAKGVA